MGGGQGMVRCIWTGQHNTNQLILVVKFLYESSFRALSLKLKITVWTFIGTSIEEYLFKEFEDRVFIKRQIIKLIGNNGNFKC
ncbi:hypothetical protein BpHYR1_009313 [Brachionus plicatilis]|uniref:Uncharacterized protein n=1 Tax=Brachionus plicatilis TaxID=10195 RepID=A0A3M7QJB0_BRAPC|nr:hypothetical protein BpHYR1_009313 [Brachionus plicatilis]